MGLFGDKSKSLEKKEKKAMWCGKILQQLGQIPLNTTCFLALKPEEKKLTITATNDKVISLPYERIKGFVVESEVSLQKTGSGLGAAVAGGLLFGGIGALVGSNIGKGGTEIKWYGALHYIDKDGNDCILNFIESNLLAEYKGINKSYISVEFEDVVNNIATKNNEDITEL